MRTAVLAAVVCLSSSHAGQVYRVITARQADARLEAAAVVLVQRCCRRFVALKTRVGVPDRMAHASVRQRFEDALILWRDVSMDGSDVQAHVLMMRRDETISRKLHASLKQLASLQQSVDERVRLSTELLECIGATEARRIDNRTRLRRRW